MADLMTGADSEGLISEKLGDLVYNNIKNHWPDPDPLGNFSNLQIGMIVHQTTNDKLWHITSDSPGYDEVLQARLSYDADVAFHDLILYGDERIEGNLETEGYNRKATVLWNDCFDHGNTVDKYQKAWDITSLNVQGSGTNTVDTNPSHITMTTDNNAIGDNEGTKTVYAIILRSRKNRSEVIVELGQTVNTVFYFGWNISATNAIAGAGEFVLVFFDKSLSNNWQIVVNPGGGAETFDSGILADTNEIIHELWTELDGTVHWSINGVEIDITGSITNKMTATAHYLIVGQVESVTGASEIVAEIDYIENEKFKIH